MKPYLARIKHWKIRNMIRLYLEAREQFLLYRKRLRKKTSISFEGMRKICDILYEIKEDHHLIFKRLIDPQKNKFEKERKYLPCTIETEFMNNIGLLFHKVMVTRELKYLMEHYIEESDSFQKTEENLEYHLQIIDSLFDEGIKTLKSLILRYKDNTLLLSLLLENPKRTKRHFGANAAELLEQFVEGKGLDEVYFSVGMYYAENGWKEKAREMFDEALKRNPSHRLAIGQVNSLKNGSRKLKIS
ncbi:hypothetical protein MJD09_20720 [bacterium]|nr:hypothetical protein [bacterium]